MNSAVLTKNNSKSEEDNVDDLLLNVVCFTCPYLFRCGPRAEHNPIDCVWLKDWINESIPIYEEQFEYEDDDVK